MISDNHPLVDFNQPYIAKNQLVYIRDAIQSGHISGDGQFTKKCHEYLQKILKTKKVLLTTSCTHALEMSAMLLNITAEEEVIVPSFTFVTTINSFVLRGAKPVFVDIRSDSLNIDEKKIRSQITKKTKAIVVVHYAGVGCEMDEIRNISREFNLPIVEDNAHGLFGKYKGQYLGTFGSLACQSFHETKNISCGEGGALIINDENLIERAEIIREKGTNRSKFFRGQIDKYSWVDVGSSYLPSEILAAVLFSQLEEAKEIQNKRKHIWEMYFYSLEDWAENENIKLPFIPSHSEQSYHMFYILLPNLEERQKFIVYLREKNIYSVFHYVPLHTSLMGNKFGYKQGDFPVTENISDRLVRLPFHMGLSESDLDYAISAIKNYHIK